MTAAALRNEAKKIIDNMDDVTLKLFVNGKKMGIAHKNYNQKTQQILADSLSGKTKYSKPFNSVKDMVKKMLD